MATAYTAEQIKEAAEELAARGIQVKPPAGLPPESMQAVRPLQRALQVKQLRGAIDVQDAVNELARRGVNVKLATAEKRDKAEIAKETEEAEYLIGSLHPDPNIRAETLAKKNTRDLERAYSESIGQLPEQFEEPQGITPATFDDWYNSTVAPQIAQRVNAFQGSDAQRAQFQNQLEEQARNNPNIQEQYRMYSVEAKNRPRSIARGTPEYYEKLRSDLTSRLQENAVKAAQVKALPGILETRAKTEAEAPMRQQKAIEELDARVQNNATLKKFREQMHAVQLVQKLGTKPNPTNVDDLGLIYSYVKLLDPGSVVREGEIALARKATPLLQNLVMSYNRLYSDKNGLLDANTRKNYLEAAQAISEGVQEEVIPELERFEALANERGVPLEKIFNAKEIPLLRRGDPPPGEPSPSAPAAPATAPAQRPKSSIRIQNGFRYQQGPDGQWTAIGPA